MADAGGFAAEGIAVVAGWTGSSRDFWGSFEGLTLQKKTCATTFEYP